ncbi:hypothetical protein T12_17008 [Trichinella patagoniensis]|uniref:Integrase zinc-binding domain-containing protein n=1 Tax=Trichinella patagoniensis TaxID=990121 RepID=A0A0V1A1R4_9BILA|nr:hypothetical protein T12_17008 [Trichinella patagoniensis]
MTKQKALVLFSITLRQIPCTVNFIKCVSVCGKHPALLQSDHEITRDLILRCHLRQLHAGVAQTLATLRQRYSIPQGRSRVRHGSSTDFPPDI